MATHSSVLAWRIPGMRGAWWATVHGVTQSRTRLKRISSSSSSSSSSRIQVYQNSQINSFPTPSHGHIYLTILTGCPTLGAGFPGGSGVQNRLPVQETQVHSMGGKTPWRRKWQFTPVFLPGKSHGQRSLAGCRPCKGSQKIWT